jgi:hypothetical protein
LLFWRGWSWICILLCLTLTLTVAQADDDEIKVQVADPYIELHTGAGEGYPVFHVVERHDWVVILYRKVDWFKVRTPDGKTGWVAIDQMQRTLAAPGVRAKFGTLAFDDFTHRRYEMGMLLGDFEGADLMTIYASYHFTPNLEVEGALSQATGDFTSQTLATISLVSTPFPKWPVSPFFGIGFGHIRNSPRKTLASADETSDNLANAGVGVRYYLTRRFMLRAEARHNVVFVNDNNNGEFVEWKIGFSFFY